MGKSFQPRRGKEQHGNEIGNKHGNESGRLGTNMGMRLGDWEQTWE